MQRTLTKKDIESIIKKQLLLLARDIKLIRGETKELRGDILVRLGMVRNEVSLTKEEITLLKVSFDDKFNELDKIMGELHFSQHDEIGERLAKLEQSASS